MVNITTTTSAVVECFNEAEVVVFESTQGVVFASAVGIGLFVDDFDFVADFATGVDNVKVGAPIDFGVTGVIEVIVQFFHCNNPPKVVDLCGLSYHTYIIYTLGTKINCFLKLFCFFSHVFCLHQSIQR